MKKITLAIIAFLVLGTTSSAQIEYQYSNNKSLSIGSYGRIGVDWSFENSGSIGRRLNLNNMGSIGGRLEEQDYLELAPALFFPQAILGDSTQVMVQMRLSVYSKSLSLFGNSSTSDLGGLTFALPEVFVEARNINNTGLNVWVGARLYRGPDIHIADHRYFNDHSGQGFGIEFKNTRFVGLFISSTDTNATVPPYFYLNIATGTPSIALRQRTVWSLEQDIKPLPNHTFTLLGEFHKMGDAGSKGDTLEKYTYPSDYGLVAGIRWEYRFKKFQDSYNRLAIRYGSRIANGGDGGLSQTWLTFGAPDLEKRDFSGAYSISIVEDFLINYSPNYSLNMYMMYTQSKGGATTDDMAETYFGREVFNKKEEFAIGLREAYYLSEKIHLIGEYHYALRRDGAQDWARMSKISFVPTFIPTGHQNIWARPHIRLVSSFAFYNKYAQDNLYSPYLEFVGHKKWGYYFGIKAEWWLWD